MNRIIAIIRHNHERVRISDSLHLHVVTLRDSDIVRGDGVVVVVGGGGHESIIFGAGGGCDCLL